MTKKNKSTKRRPRKPSPATPSPATLARREARIAALARAITLSIIKEAK